MTKTFAELRANKSKLVDNLHLQSAVVLFLVALPLNLGVAASSGVPAYLGIVSGVIGSLLVGTLSGAPLMVSGPDAGIGVLILQMIQENGVQTLGVTVTLAGVLQLSLGLGRGAIWFRVFSPAVVNGMLAGMGLIIILTQFLIMLESKPGTTGLMNLTALPNVIAKAVTAAEGLPHHPAACIGLLTITVALAWPKIARGALKRIPPALPAIFVASITTAALDLPTQLIEVPQDAISSMRLTSVSDLANGVSTISIWLCALTLAFVTSAQSLLTATAIDSLRNARKSNLDRELIAQGIGNIVCGLLGTLPVAGVLLRSMANVQSGARSRAPNIIHGVLILSAILFLPWLVNKMPVCSLAALLVLIGGKMIQTIANNIRNYARAELAIVAATSLAILATNPFSGIIIGFVLAAAKELYALAYLGIKLEEVPGRSVLHLWGSATFLQLPRLITVLESVSSEAELHVRIDELHYIDHACLELLMERAELHQKQGGDVIIDWKDFQAGSGAVRAGGRQSSMSLAQKVG